MWYIDIAIMQPEINFRNWYLPHVMKHSEAIPPLFLNFADDLDPRESEVLRAYATYT